MSFLKNVWRQSRLVKLEQATTFGYYGVSHEFSPRAIQDSYEAQNKKALSKGKSQHFYKAMNKLLEKLAQAQLHGDFGLKGQNVMHPTEAHRFWFSDELSCFVKSRSKIHEKLNAFKGADKKDIAAWFKANQKLIGDFLTELDVIYKLRTPGAKFKDLLWELADALLVVLAAVGLAAAVIHLAGVGIFAGAFAHFVAPAAVTATMVEGATAVTALVATGLFKAVYLERREIKAAIEKDLTTTAEAAAQQDFLSNYVS